MNVTWTIVTIIIGGCLALVGSLIVLNLQSIKSCLRAFTQRVEKQDERIEKTKEKMDNINADFAKCKVDCERSFVNSEIFLRETGYTRRSIQSLTESVNRMEGTLRVVEKLPQICGDISREIVKEMKNGGNNHG